jgi:DNA-binding winged helix-turn-helix (wHTH) protein
MVIKELSEGKDHISYRNSKLTTLLRESLGGNSKTTLICTVSRKGFYLDESI